MKLHQHKLFAPATMLLLLAVAFRFDGARVEWFWHSQPLVAALLAVAGTACCAVMLAERFRHGSR